MDFTGGLEIYQTIEAGLKDLEIGVLGMSPCPLGGALLSPAPGLTPTPEHSLLAPSLADTPLCPRPVSLGLLE